MTSNALIFVLKRFWASPYTLLGLALGSLGAAAGGSFQLRRGVVEFHGTGVRWLLSRLPDGELVLAMTLGHTILGQNEAALDIAREHEHVHVRQFERWGPFMGPAYLLASAWVWFAGGRVYRDNPFEREAYDHDDLAR